MLSPALLNEFKTYLQSLSVSQKTLENYLSDVRRFIRQIGPIGQIEEINWKLEIGNWKLSLISSNLPPRTINRHLSSLRKFSKFLFEKGLINEDLSWEIKNLTKQKILSTNYSLPSTLMGPFSSLSLLSITFITVITVINIINSSPQVLPLSTESPQITLKGDVQGPLDQTRVVALQGSPLGETGPRLGAFLIGNGREWVSRTLSGAISLKFTPGESGPTPGVLEAVLNDNVVTSQKIQDDDIGASDLAPTFTFADSDFFDLGAINNSSKSEGLKLPQSSSCSSNTTEGQVCWDSDDHLLTIGNGGGGVTSIGSYGSSIDTGEITDATLTAVDVELDTLDFTEFQDTLDLDASTEINLGAFNLTLDLDSTGDFVIQDAGTAFVTFSDTGATTFANDIAVNGGDITTSATTWNFDVGGGGTIYFRDGTNNLLTIADGGTVGNVTVSGTTTSSGVFTASSTSTLAGDITFSSATPNIAINNTESLTITDGTNTLFTLADAGTTGNLTISGDIAVNGGDVTTTATTWNLDVGNTGSILFRDGTNTLLTIADGGTVGNVTVSGTTTSTGAFTASSTSTLAGDITFSSTTPNIAINNTESLTITDGTNTLFTLADAGTTGNLTISGDIAVNGGDITTTATTWNLDVGNTGSIVFRDGTNTLASIVDQGAFATVRLTDKASTGDPSTCTAGDIYFNLTDATMKACTAANTWEALDGGGAVAWSGITAPTANLSLAHAGNTTTFTFNSVTTADAFTMSSTGLTTGNLLVLNNTNATSTGSLISYANSGSGAALEYTTTPIAAGATGSYSTLTYLPQALRGNIATAVSGYIFVVGGVNGSATAQSTVYSAPIRADGTIGAFSTLTYLPNPRQDSGLTNYNGYLFVLGGGDGNDGIIQSTVWSAPINSDGTIGAFSTLTYLPAQRFSSGNFVTAYNGYLFVVGAENSAGEPQSTVYSAPINSSGTIGAFSTLTYLPGLRDRHSVTQYNGYLFVIAGMTGSPSSSIQSTVYSAPINSDGTIGAFSTLTYLPQRLQDTTSAIYNGYLFVLGGQDSSLAEAQSTVYSAQITGGTLGAFSTLTYLPAARNRFPSAIYNGYLFVTGGAFNNTPQSTVYSSPLRTTALALNTTSDFAQGLLLDLRENNESKLTIGYNGDITTQGSYISDIVPKSDGTTGSYATTTFLPLVRDAHSAVGYNGYLYVVGGCNVDISVCNVAGEGVSTVYLAQIRGDGLLGGVFTTLTYLPKELGAPSAVAHNGYLFVVGGQDAAVQSTVYSAPIRSDGTIGAFSTLTYLPLVRTASSALAYNGYLFVVGGCNNLTANCSIAGRNVSTVYSAPINSDGTIGAFSTLTYLPKELGAPSAVAYNGYLFVAGGQDAAVQSTVYSAPILAGGTIGAFSTLTYLPLVRTAPSAVAYNGYLFVVGGCNVGINLCNAAGETVSTVYSAPIRHDGTIGAFSTLTYLTEDRGAPSAVAYNGYLFVTGGLAGASVQSTVYYASLTTSRAFVFNANSQTWPEGTGLGGSASLWSLQNNGDAVANINAQGDLMIRGKLSANSVVIGTDKPGDLAENMEVGDPSIEAGDVVSISSSKGEENSETLNTNYLIPNTEGKLVKSSKPYDSRLIGVISTSPSITLSPLLPNSRPVVLSGRSPVKVSTENGPIEPGDYLTSSSTPGMAMKATRSGPVIGKALEGQNFASGKILALISPSFFIEEVAGMAGIGNTPGVGLDSPGVDDLKLSSLLVLGHSTLGPTVFTDGINIGGISIDPGGKDTPLSGVEGSIQSLTTLNLQPSILCPTSSTCPAISLLSEALEIDSDGNLTIARGHLIGNETWRGSATLTQGQTHVEISQTWKTPPTSILATPSWPTNFLITDLNGQGFKIKVEEPPGKEERLYWMAVW